MKVDGLHYLNANLRDFEPTDMHKVATILHPLLKNLNRLSNDEKTRAYRLLDETMRKIRTEQTVTNTQRRASTPQDFFRKMCMLVLLKFFSLDKLYILDHVKTNQKLTINIESSPKI